MAATGNVRECEGSQNSIEIEDLARFAVEEHNKKQGDYVEFFLGLEVHFKEDFELFVVMCWAFGLKFVKECMSILASNQRLA
ncbi:uncharacterized protein [Primulina eburnea]|uniref:uncharacterized protein isoform X1 n=1 Tax=Primulina eburnea TaxID=1245227 RepID=UPI003C6C8E84